MLMHSVGKHDCFVLYREHSSVRRKLVYRKKYRSHNHHQHPMVLANGQLRSRQSWTCAQDLPILEICYEQSLIPSVLQATEWHAGGMKCCWEHCAANQITLYDFAQGHVLLVLGIFCRCIVSSSFQQPILLITGFCWLIRCPIAINMRWSQMDFAPIIDSIWCW